MEDTKTVVKSIDEYITPITYEIINSLTNKIESMLNIHKVVSQDDNSVFVLPDGIKYNNQIPINTDIDSIGNDRNLIFDAKHFYYTDEEIKNHLLNENKFNTLFNKTKERGTLILLIDYNNLKYIRDNLKPIVESGYNLLMKLHVINKYPFLAVLSIQKFKSKADFENVKILVHELYDNNTMTKPLTVTLSNLYKTMKYMNEMFQYQGFLRELHPGSILKINVKETFWSDNVDYTLTVIDSENQELIHKSECKAVIVSRSYSKDFLYISREGNLQLCERVDAARLILIRSNAFNSDDIDTIKEKLSNYIVMFKFTTCNNDNIPILLLSNPRSEEYEICRENGLVIKDVVENENKDTFRQLVFLDNPNEVQSEVKLILTSKNKVKSDSNYIGLPTIDKYLQKNLRSCLDDDFVCSYYIKCILSGVFFNKIDISKENANVLVLGAGIGTVNHFINKLFNGKANFTSVEISKNVVELGSKYFGFKNDSPNNTWIYSDANAYVKKEAQSGISNKYDMVVIDINNIDGKDGISPPPIFFDPETLNAIKVLMKDTGIYIINLMTRSFSAYSYALKQLESVFDLVFMVENNEDLNKIHYCFKTKLTNEEYVILYQNNYDNLSVNGNISIIENDYKKILSKVTDINDLKKEINSKI
jgi:hypothetical protein